MQRSCSFLYFIFTSWKGWHFVRFMISLSLKKHIRKFRKVDIWLQKEEHAIRRMIYSEGYVQKGDNQKVATYEVLHPQSFFHTIQWSIQKVKHDLVRSKRSTNKSEMLMNLQRLLFFFCVTSTCWGRKLYFSLSSLKLMDQSNSRLKIYTLQRIYLKTIKAGRMMKSWLDCWIFCALTSNFWLKNLLY